MNFFGHAALATQHFEAAVPAPSELQLAKLCAGAMLPDFIGMLRLGRPHATDEALARGVAFHHRTDEAFHDLPPFLGLSRAAFAWLSERGLPRGPARAVAHIGVEMLLDEPLAEDARARAAYRAALSVPLAGLLELPGPHELGRLEELRAALRERAHGARHPSPALVAERIRRTLSGRPRLETNDAGQALLGEWVAHTRPLVFAEAPDILARLRLLLANFGGAQ
ncbi:MAG: hypothetical protein EOO73_30815 [Myxococcales bacterium]|nr:MAG: hypothetical protein EOO73_30815 [Myxococcales bacterium]